MTDPLLTLAPAITVNGSPLDDAAELVSARVERGLCLIELLGGGRLLRSEIGNAAVRGACQCEVCLGGGHVGLRGNRRLVGGSCGRHGAIPPGG